MGLAQREMIINHLSFDATVLCGRNNTIDLFTSFLLLTHMPTAYMHKKNKTKQNKANKKTKTKLKQNKEISK